MVRIEKHISYVVVLILLFAFLTGCNRIETHVAEEESIPIGDAYHSSEVSEITTKCGRIFIPEQYQSALKTIIKENKDGCEMSFYTEQKGDKINLFTVEIGSGSGEYVGDLTDNDGVVRAVYVTVPDLGELNSYSEEQQDELYALQEAVNVVVEHLK